MPPRRRLNPRTIAKAAELLRDLPQTVAAGARALEESAGLVAATVEQAIAATAAVREAWERGRPKPSPRPTEDVRIHVKRA